MLEYKASTIARVPVALTVTATGLPHAGVLAAAVTVTVVKSNGVIVTYTPSGGQWTEFTWDAYSGSGYYNLSIPVGDTDVVGILNYCVSVAGDDLYFGVVNIVANLEADTYTRIGAPVTSVSADIAAVQTKLGTPAGASVSADVATVSAKTINLPPDPADASDVASAITAAVTSIKGVSAKDLTQVDTKLGTPAGASVSADIAAVKADTGAIAGDITAAVTSIKGASNKDLTQVDTAVGTVSVNLVEVLGLLHKNAVLGNQVYNLAGRLTSAILYVYDSAANAIAHTGAGLLVDYDIAATYDIGTGVQTSFRLTPRGH
jgi:hypothetical protein